MFIKSVVNGNVGAEVESIIENLILRPDEISAPSILKALRNLADGIETKLKSKEGHELFVSEQLKEPLLNVLDNQARTKSVELYNVIYPALNFKDNIPTPSRFLTIKCDYTSQIQNEYPEVWDRIQAYMKIHNIHSMLKKVLTFDAGSFTATNMNKVTDADITFIADHLIADILPEFISKISNNIPNILIFRNGYRDSGAKGISRDEIFYSLMKDNNNDVTKVLRVFR